MAEPAIPLGGIGRRECDYYGFPLDLNANLQMVRERCNTRERKQSIKWVKIEDSGERIPMRPKGKLKKLIRKGIPPHLRAKAWMELSGGAAKAEARPTNYYNSLLGVMDNASLMDEVSVASPDDPVAMQIELDLGRTFPSNHRVDSRLGRSSLQRVLMAYARHNPGIGYCQSMNYVAAMLLLVLESEEKAFWVMAALLDDRLYPASYSENLSGCQVEIRTLGRLVDRKMPKLSAHLKATGTEMTFLATEWFLCLFSRTFPSETTARVWDAVMSEGPKVLHRVAIAMLKQEQANLLAASNTGDIIQALQAAARQIVDRDALMKAAFRSVGSFPLRRIEKLRQEEQVVVDGEMRERAERRAANSAATASKGISSMYSVSQGGGGGGRGGEGEGGGAGVEGAGVGGGGGDGGGGAGENGDAGEAGGGKPIITERELGAGDAAREVEGQGGGWEDEPVREEDVTLTADGPEEEEGAAEGLGGPCPSP